VCNALLVLRLILLDRGKRIHVHREFGCRMAEFGRIFS